MQFRAMAFTALAPGGSKRAVRKDLLDTRGTLASSMVLQVHSARFEAVYRGEFFQRVSPPLMTPCFLEVRSILIRREKGRP